MQNFRDGMQVGRHRMAKFFAELSAKPLYVELPVRFGLLVVCLAAVPFCAVVAVTWWVSGLLDRAVRS